MVRRAFLWLALAAPVVAQAGRLNADPPDPASQSGASSTVAALESTLVLQKAMVMAKAFLRMDDPRRAVEVLEQHLAKVNGHSTYLELLRDSYRAYIKELGLKNQAASAQRYLQRLLILDPSAANDPTLRPADPPIMPIAAKDPGPALPNFQAAQMKAAEQPKFEQPKFEEAKLDATGSPPASGVKAPVFRAIREMPGDDPFDLANQRIARNRIAASDPSAAAALLTKGHQEFDRRRYSEARVCYEQLLKLDSAKLDQVRDRLAYCLLDGAVERLNRNDAAALGDVRREVTSAVAMAPQLRPTGEWLLKEIDQRGKSAPSATADPPLNLQHFGKNPQGWQVTETTNFRIFHNQNRDLVERVALIAERTRQAMARKWFGLDDEPWSPKCELVLHATASEYSRNTGVPATSPGHSRIETDPASFRVIGRRIDLHVDTMGMLEAVLPHETTHIVLAGKFGGHQVPRWADEGIAVLTEPLEKIEQHRRNLAKCRQDGTVVPVRDLMNFANYPEAKQITAFYAQSVMLVDFLTQQRGPLAFTGFLRDGLGEGYEPALRKHYGWSFSELQSNWERHVAGATHAAAIGR